ncbi:MAG TPA: tRNA preQ1(34) S-adenosylmethionine ribosyltransferase-isomerase QueA [Azospirillaceae bacterium]|nr:tRNA preQ1(34) S-adenosylmethionine ribosyltransferase-isomerase QueA [Azospirillaceae bacterium]
MKTAEFDFDLPPELVAQEPARPRDAARMLVVGETLDDAGVLDLPRHLGPGDLLVVNDTRVLPSRLRGRKGEGAVELMLHKPVDGAGTWWAFARPAKRLRPGDRVQVAPGFTAEVLEKAEGGEVRVRLDADALSPLDALKAHGEVPLPPYIRREGGATTTDRDDYQTIFARRDGAVAASTAALHFTPRLAEAVKARGVDTVTVTLHVGAGTFLPVKAEDVREHRMHSEWGEMTAEAAARINAVRAAGGRVVAVGTTALRVLETAAGRDGHVASWQGETDLFILPGYRFKVVDRLMTNFHLPKSTLFMLVCAFAGTQRMKAAYAHAVAQRYRFFSYGDSTLLTRSDPT